MQVMKDYKRLGDYIREVNVRNRKLEVTDPMGININKHFMPSVANVIGTDLSTYKLVSKMQFACNLMHVGRDEKTPMAMHTKDNLIIVSPAYFVFEVINTEQLLPEYLMMWFRRPEFDRNAWFYTDADVRGGMGQESLLDMQLPIPSITRQREIVAEYETLTRRIRINEQMIQNLESTAQTLYRKMFVDGIDKENLPEGWRMGTLGEVANIVTGKLNSEDAVNNGIYPFFTCSQETYKTDSYAFEQEAVLLAGNNASAIYPLKIYKGKFNAYQRTYVISSMHNFICNKQIYYTIKDKLEDFKGTSQGTTTTFLTIKILNDIPIVISDMKSHINFSQKVEILYNIIQSLNKENSKLTDLQSLLLAKIGQ